MDLANEEHIRRLSEMIQNERDSDRLIELARELIVLLDEARRPKQTVTESRQDSFKSRHGKF
jgi:hypothetical protein